MFIGIAINLTGRLLSSASPASLFINGEQGVWYDPSDISTLFQDNAGTTPVTTPGQQVGKVLDKSGRGNHATQTTSTQRPIYGVNPIVGTRNQYLYTEQFDNAYWVKANITLAVDSTTAPNGTLTADKIQETSATTFFVISQNPVGSFSTTYTWSCYAKAAERTLMTVGFTVAGVAGAFNLTTGQTTATTGSPVMSATSVGNGWWRCSMSFATPASGSNILYHLFGPIITPGFGTYTGVAGYGIYVWGAQLELGSSATAYQRVGNQYDVTQAGVQSVGYLAFDGVDDGMVTGTITPATNKVQVFSGLRKLSDAAQQIVAEMSASIASNAGAFAVTAPNSAAANYNFSSKGTTQTDNTVTTFTAPITNVITGLGDISGPSNLIRVNGTQVGSVLTTQGTGNYLAYPLYIGRRGGTTLPFNGRIYSLIVRFGPNLTTGQITSTESWVNSKTGAY